MSTNDTVLVLANGASGMPADPPQWQTLQTIPPGAPLAHVRAGQGRRPRWRTRDQVRHRPRQGRAHVSGCEKSRRGRLQIRSGEILMERRRSELGPHHSCRRLLARPHPRGAGGHPHRWKSRLPRRPSGGNPDGGTAEPSSPSPSSKSSSISTKAAPTTPCIPATFRPNTSISTAPNTRIGNKRGKTGWCEHRRRRPRFHLASRGASGDAAGPGG